MVVRQPHGVRGCAEAGSRRRCAVNPGLPRRILIDGTETAKERRSRPAPRRWQCSAAVAGVGGVVGACVSMPIRNRFGEVHMMLLMQCSIPFAFVCIASAMFILAR